MEYDENNIRLNTDFFEVLYKKYQPALYAYSRKFINDPEIAKDLVQDAFIKLWEDVNIASIHTSILGYLKKTVHNLCLLHLRSMQIHHRFENRQTLKLREQELNFFSSAYAYTSIFLKDIESITNRCIDNLPPQSQAIFRMSRFENKSHAEIAQELNLSVRTVENHIFRSLKILKKELSDYMITMLVFLSSLNQKHPAR